MTEKQHNADNGEKSQFFSSNTARDLFRDLRRASLGDKISFIDFAKLDEFPLEVIEAGPPAERDWWFEGFDHAALAVPLHLMELMTDAFKLLGARIFHDQPDTNPDEPSSMWLRGIELDYLHFAFVAPLNRDEISQVQKSLDIHGMGVQHIAIRVRNIKSFVAYIEQTGIFRLLGPLHERDDLFGPVKQVFTAPLDDRWSPEEGFFFEFLERPAQHRRRRRKPSKIQKASKS